MAETLDQLNAAIKEAMKNKDTARRDTLRLLSSAIKQLQVDSQRDLSNDEEQDILQKEAKKRRESIGELAKAGRVEQAEQEEYELGVIEAFLPAQLSEAEIRVMVQEAIAQSGASSQREMGKVMGLLQARTKGVADGKLVSSIVKESLSQS